MLPEVNHDTRSELAEDEETQLEVPVFTGGGNCVVMTTKK